jgi:chromosome segregation ATPase
MCCESLFHFLFRTLANRKKAWNDGGRLPHLFAPNTTPLRAPDFLPAADAQMLSNSNISSPEVLAESSNGSAPTAADNGSSGDSDPSASPPDRVIVDCPKCRATLKIRRVYLGCPVKCKNCAHIFTLEMSADSVAKPAEERPRATSTQQAGEHPQANGVSHREEQAHERLMGEHDRLVQEHRDLKTKHEELELESERLRAARRSVENEKQTAIDEIEALRKTLAQRDQALCDQSEQHRTALESERQARDQAELVYEESLCRLQEEHQSADASRKHFQEQCLEMAAALEKLKGDYQLLLDAEQTKQAEFRQRAADNDSLRAEVDRLCEENRVLLAQQLANAQLATQLQEHVAELQERNADLGSARNALDQLRAEKQTAIDEIAALGNALAAREKDLRDQSDEHRSALDSERQARERVEQVHGESLCRVQEEHQSAEASRKHLQEQCLEMAAALEKLKGDHQSELEAEHTKQKALADELLHLKAESEETSRLASQLISIKTAPADENLARDLELEAVRAQVADLTQWLELSERAGRELVEILRGLGVQIHLAGELKTARFNR